MEEVLDLLSGDLLPKDYKDGSANMSVLDGRKKLLKDDYNKRLVRPETIRIPIDNVLEVPPEKRQRIKIKPAWVKSLKTRYLEHGKSPLGQAPGAMIKPPELQKNPQSQVL